MARIILYQIEECPFCQRVREKLAEKNIEYEKVNVPREREDPVRKRIAQESGVLTVPVIEINGEFMGESQEIIDEIEKRF